MASKIVELFGIYTRNDQADFSASLVNQICPYTHRKCIKTRKSSPDIAIGTCTVNYGKEGKDIIICPHRLIENNQIFTDCLHLLTLHEPGNSLYIVPEVTIPGGSVDYFLVSAKNGKVMDFVGIELQTMDTTGTVWPERQRLLMNFGHPYDEADTQSDKPFGMNWKMTAKTILIQMHHKSETFEHINKHLVLVIQEPFLDYMRNEFSFSHIDSVRLGDPIHFHSYNMMESNGKLNLSLIKRLSTDSSGISVCLGLQAQSRVDLQVIITILESKLDDKYRLTFTNT